MNKNLWLIGVFILFALLGVFLFTNPTIRPDITFKEVKDGGKVPPKASIVKDIQLDKLVVKDSIVKKDLKKAKRNVDERKNACEKNSQELFKKNDFFKLEPSEKLNLVFEKTLDRKESNQAFLKVQELLKSDMPINLNIYYSLLMSLEICRPKKSMAFLDKTIEGLKNGGQEYRETLTPLLIKNIKDNLLGDQYSPINLSLVFGKLSRLVNYGLIKEPFSQEILDLRKHFLNYEKEVNRNLKRAEGNEQLRDLTIEHFDELREISVELKSILESI